MATIRVIEQLSTASARGDRGGRRSRQREFVVLNVLPGSIPIRPGDPPIVDELDESVILPVPGMFHPTDTFLLVDSVDPRPLGDALGSRVTVLYSATGQFKQPDTVQPEDPAEYATASYSNVEVERQIPIQRRVKKTKAGNDPKGDPIIVVNVWEVFDHKLIEVNENTQVRVSVQALSAQDREDINAQANKIHTLPGGAKGLFRPFQSSPVGKRVAIFYQWEMDDGTSQDAVTIDGIGVTMAVPAGGPNGNINPRPATGLIRDPFALLETFPSEDPTDDTSLGMHKWIQIRRYKEVPDGWQNLPGNPGQVL